MLCTLCRQKRTRYRSGSCELKCLANMCVGFTFGARVDSAGLKKNDQNKNEVKLDGTTENPCTLQAQGRTVTRVSV